jgi:Histidine kinase-, DNA gyrase B-, and HSP90-like ATPase
MITNLLVNAIQYSPTGGTVCLTIDGGTEEVRIEVSDSCGGLTAEEFGRMFDAGWRRDHARTPGTRPGSSGAGIGLAIVCGRRDPQRYRCRRPEGCRLRDHGRTPRNPRGGGPPFVTAHRLTPLSRYRFIMLSG